MDDNTRFMYRDLANLLNNRRERDNVNYVRDNMSRQEERLMSRLDNVVNALYSNFQVHTAKEAQAVEGLQRVNERIVERMANLEGLLNASQVLRNTNNSHSSRSTDDNNDVVINNNRALRTREQELEDKYNDKRRELQNDYNDRAQRFNADKAAAELKFNSEKQQAEANFNAQLATAQQQFQIAMDKLAQDKQDIEVRKQFLESENAKLEANKKTLELEKTRLTEEVRLLADAKKDFDAKLSQAVKDFNVEKDAFKREVETLKIEVASVGQARDVLIADKSKLEGLYNALEKEKLALENDKVQLERNKKDLEDERNSLRLKNNNLSTEVTTIEGEKDRVKMEKNQIQAEMVIIRQAKEAVLLEVAKAQNERDQFKREKATVEQEKNDIINDRNKLKKEMEVERDKHKKEMEGIKIERDNIKKDKEALDAERTQLSVDIVSLKREKQKGEESQQQMIKDKKILEEERNQLNMMVTLLKKDNNDSIKNLTNEKAKEIATTFQAQIDSKDANILVLKKELEEQTTRLNEARIQLDNINQAKNVDSKRTTELENDLKNKNSELQLKTSELQLKTSELQLKTNELGALKNTMAGLSQTIADLKASTLMTENELKRYKTEYSVKNFKELDSAHQAALRNLNNCQEKLINLGVNTSQLPRSRSRSKPPINRSSVINETSSPPILDSSMQVVENVSDKTSVTTEPSVSTSLPVTTSLPAPLVATSTSLPAPLKEEVRLSKDDPTQLYFENNVLTKGRFVKTFFNYNPTTTEFKVSELPVWVSTATDNEPEIVKIFLTNTNLTMPMINLKDNPSSWLVAWDLISYDQNASIILDHMRVSNSSVLNMGFLDIAPLTELVYFRLVAFTSEQNLYSSYSKDITDRMTLRIALGTKKLLKTKAQYLPIALFANYDGASESYKVQFSQLFSVIAYSDSWINDTKLLDINRVVALKVDNYVATSNSNNSSFIEWKSFYHLVLVSTNQFLISAWTNNTFKPVERAQHVLSRMIEFIINVTSKKYDEKFIQLVYDPRFDLASSSYSDKNTHNIAPSPPNISDTPNQVEYIGLLSDITIRPELRIANLALGRDLQYATILTNTQYGGLNKAIYNYNNAVDNKSYFAPLYAMHYPDPEIIKLETSSATEEEKNPNTTKPKTNETIKTDLIAKKYFFDLLLLYILSFGKNVPGDILVPKTIKTLISDLIIVDSRDPAGVYYPFFYIFSQTFSANFVLAPLNASYESIISSLRYSLASILFYRDTMNETWYSTFVSIENLLGGDEQLAYKSIISDLNDLANSKPRQVKRLFDAVEVTQVDNDVNTTQESKRKKMVDVTPRITRSKSQQKGQAPVAPVNNQPVHNQPVNKPANKIIAPSANKQVANKQVANKQVANKPPAPSASSASSSKFALPPPVSKRPLQFPSEEQKKELQPKSTASKVNTKRNTWYSK